MVEVVPARAVRRMRGLTGSGLALSNVGVVFVAAVTVLFDLRWPDVAVTVADRFKAESLVVEGGAALALGLRL